MKVRPFPPVDSLLKYVAGCQLGQTTPETTYLCAHKKASGKGSNPVRIARNALNTAKSSEINQNSNDMVTKYINQPLGIVPQPFAPTKRHWIGTAIGAGIGLASSLFGGIKASEAAKRAAQKQAEMEAKESAWYKRRYNEDYLDTAAGQNLVRRAKEYARENWRKAQGAQAVTGATDASTAIAKDQGNKVVGDTIANIAATDQERKAQIDNIHMNNEQNFAQMSMQRDQNQAQSIQNAAGQASNAIISAGAAIEGMETKPNLTGASNNGVTIDPSITDGTFREQIRRDAFGG